MPQEPIGKAWQYAIAAMYKNSPRGEPKPGAIKIHKAFEGLVKNGSMPGPAPSERAVGRYLVKVRSMTPEELSRFAVVSWPWTYLDGELPWKAAPKVFEAATTYYPNRVLVRVAWWAWRIHESKPETDWSSECWYAGKAMAAWEVSPEINAHIPGVIEKWLLGRGELNSLDWATGKTSLEISPDSPWAAFEALTGRLISRDEVSEEIRAKFETR